MSGGGYFHWNLLFNHAIEVNREAVVTRIGEPIEITYYDDKQDETIYYSNVREAPENQNITLVFPKNILLEITSTNPWTVYTLSFPVSLNDELYLELFTINQVKDIFTITSFTIAFGIHDYEMDAVEVEEDYLHQIENLQPALLYKVENNHLKLEYGSTRLDGLPR